MSTKTQLEVNDIIKVAATKNKSFENVTVTRVTKSQAFAGQYKFNRTLIVATPKVGDETLICRMIPQVLDIICTVINPEDLQPVHLSRKVVAVLHVPKGMSGATLQSVRDKVGPKGNLQQEVIKRSKTTIITFKREEEKKLKTKRTKTTVAGEAKGPGIIEQILALHVAGKTNKEIIEAGFNKSTVGRQVAEYKKRQQESK